MNELGNYVAIPAFIVSGIVFAIGGLGIAKLLRPDHPNPEKLAAYECGEEASGSSHMTFNSRFYIIALLFVLFEVELVFLFPAVIVLTDIEANVATEKMWAWLSLIEVFAFVAALFAGLIYAWRSGFLEWQMSGQKDSDFVPVIPKSLYHQVNQRVYSKRPHEFSSLDSAA
jgi:NADH-quinone oxidoreductase subunit A